MYKRLLHLSSNTKQLIHCSTLFFFIIYYVYKFTTPVLDGEDKNEPNKELDPFVKYGTIWTCMLYFFRLSILLVFPQVIFNFLGLTLYNAFTNKVDLKGSPQNAPFICFRVVTRGDYPELVDRNIKRNLKTCLDVGLEHFTFEIATDQTLNLPLNQNKVREILIPKSYQTKTGALFKVKIFKKVFFIRSYINFTSF